MKRFLKWFLIVAAVAIVGFVAYTFIRTRSAQAQASAQNGLAFETAPVERGSLTMTILASGSVRARQSAVLSWQASGKVGQVTAALGERVEADEVLADLDPTSLSQSLIQAQTDLINAQQALQDLKDNAGTNAAEAQSNLVAAQQELDDAVTARASLNYKRASNDTIDAAHANVVLAQNEVDDAQSFYDQVKDRPESDQLRAQALSALATAKQKRDRNQANYNYLISGPDATEIAAADARVQLAETSLADAQRKYDRIKDGPSADDLKIAENRVTIAQAAVNQSRIVAPFGGTVTTLEAMPGDVVSPNQEALRLDDLSSVYVDLQVTEVDVNKIQVGQSAEVTLDAVTDGRYTAEVVEVGQVGTTSSGVVYFNVTLQLKESDPRVRPGMTASASIAVSSQEGVLLVPNRAIRSVDGNHVVYVRAPGAQGAGLRPVTVQVGDSDESKTIITDGLEEGDLVVTNPPTDAQAAQQNFGMRGIFGGGPTGGQPPDDGVMIERPSEGGQP